MSSIEDIRKHCRKQNALGVLTLMDQKARASRKYRRELDAWLAGETSTLGLRRLCRPFGDYWNDLSFSNAVDHIDSASLIASQEKT